MKSFKFISSFGLLSLILLFIFSLIGLPNIRTATVLAQSPADAIETNTPAPTPQPPTATFPPPTSTPTAEDQVWLARLVDVIPNAVLGGGAILRVYVQDRPGELIEVQLADTVIRNTAGSKPEYGPFAAEFAPLPAGQWLVSVPGLGANLGVQTDYRSLFVVEFSQVPAAQATAAAQKSATPTPLGNTLWEGRKTGVIEGPSVAGALLRVKVEGRSGLPVDLITFTDFIGQGVTGSKSEAPADEVEFAGLSAGRYTIIPHGLNTQFTVDLEVNTTTFVEFFPVKPQPTPTSTPIPSPQPPTATPLPPTPTSPPTPTFTPTPTATPPKRWLMVVEQREPISQAAPSLVIQIDGQREEEVMVSRRDPLLETSCITEGQAGNDRYACELRGLLPGAYTVSWKEGGLWTPLRLETGQRVVLALKQELAPLEATTWQARFNQNTSNALPTGLINSTVTVRVANRPGQVISLINSRGQRYLCETDETGLCQFTQLGAGVYTIEPANIPAQQALYLDGRGQVQVEFEELPLITQGVRPVATPIIGHGAIPKKSQAGGGGIRASVTATIVPPPTPTPFERNSIPTLAPSQATVTPTPAFAWSGAVAENYSHPGQTLVVRAPLGDHPVILKSGTWQVEGRTDSKPEYGPGTVEFAGLSPGDYTVILAGLSEMPITLAPDHFVLVHFTYGLVPEPTPTPQPGQWTAAILSNTSWTESGGGVWSILTLEIGGVNNLPIRISTDGFETECITGTKPELGDGVCQIGGLWPATYRVQPAGLPISIDVPLDGRGAAWVAFWQQ